MLRSLLVPLDLSPDSEKVRGRVALLPVAGDARITLLHVVPNRLSRDVARRAQHDAKKVLSVAAKRLSAVLPKGVAVHQAVGDGSPAEQIAEHAASVKAEVIVMGRGGGRALRDAFIGSTAERVIRQGRLPVLVVRLVPRAPYRRPAVAMDIDRAAQQSLLWLLRVIAPPLPRVAIVHAYDAPFHGLIYPSLSAKEASEYRGYYREAALRELDALLTGALAKAGLPADATPVFKTHVRYGSARSIVDKLVRTARVDLLVLGTHGYAGLAHAFLGTVAGDVLREVPCDVLMVPPRREPRRA
jgi:nucleotide-binding universal stress UspA family protein